MTTSKAQQRAVNKYIKGNYDRLNITLPKGRKATVEAFADAQGLSVNRLVNDLLRGRLGLTDEEWKEV